MDIAAAIAPVFEKHLRFRIQRPGNHRDVRAMYRFG